MTPAEEGSLLGTAAGPLHVERQGPSGAPRVLLLHGGGTAGWSWCEQRPALEGYRSLVPDLPGHGLSPGPLRLPEAAARLVALLEQEGPARVVGLSLGSQLALTLLARRPDLVLGALLSGTLAGPVPGGAWLSGTPNRLLSALVWPVRSTRPMLALNRLALELPARSAPDLAEDVRRLSFETALDVTRENLSFAPDPALARCPVPVTLLVGSREHEVLRRSACRLVRLLPLARAYSVQGVNHLWPLGHPDRYNAVLRAWLEAAPWPPGLTPLT